ncbi:drug resistance protein [Colletotrichum higginsianum]|uniref:Major facilitator superfamily (MFS) profile domain-containing protein n=1 Tax=Colletotrichum higginsianum TaxID=80884 RepID=A0A4T0VEX6_9PEZI|nr:hypothetical protein CH35J_011703 [Colletotrichum higginsianum]GJD03888.1 drug resistance protein [Colletotrichum higginsianum]
MSGRVFPFRPFTVRGDIPAPIVADPGADAGSKELRAAASRNDADDEVTGGYPKLSKSRSILLTAVISTTGLLTKIVVSIYNISTGSLMLLWGRLADVYGRGLVYLLGSVLFTISDLCLPFTR